MQEARENPLSKHGEIGNGRESRVDNIKSTQGGTSTDYTLRRLARDGHDELLDQIEAGEISVNKTLYLPRVFRLLLSEQTQRETVAGKLANMERGDAASQRGDGQICLSQTQSLTPDGGWCILKGLSDRTENRSDALG